MEGVAGVVGVRQSKRQREGSLRNISSGAGCSKAGASMPGASSVKGKTKQARRGRRRGTGR